MKSDLIITRFKTETVIGTKESNDTKTFFGSKMVDIEDVITVDNSKIQYSEVYTTGNTENNGYQYYDDVDNKENIYLIDLSDVKYNNHSMSLLSQSTVDLKSNTQWKLSINWKNILNDYIFYQLKNRRTFKCIKYTDVLSENINLFINNYISDNLLNRYQFSQLNFYVQYFDLEDGDEFTDPNLSFNPIFTADVRRSENLIANVNATVLDSTLTVNYKQTQSSENKKFNYYFDMIFTKV